MRVRTPDDASSLERLLIQGEHLLPVPLERFADAPVIAHLGCGSGFLLARLAYVHPTARLIGVDAHAEAVGAARANVATFGNRVSILHATMAASPRRLGLAGEPLTHSIDSLLDDARIPIVDGLVVQSGACSAIAGGSPATLGRVRQVRVHAPDERSAGACREALASGGLVCVVDPLRPSSLLAWARSLAALRARYPTPQEHLDPGPGRW